MTQHLDEKDVRAIALNTRIGLADEEIAQLTGELNTIIESLHPIVEYDLEGVEPTYHPIDGLSNVMCEDCEGVSFSQETALKNATNTKDGSFLIPAILAGGDAS